MKNICILVCLGTSALLSGCKGPMGMPPMRPPGGFAVPVKVMELKDQEIYDHEKVLATVDSRQSVRIYPKVNAYIKSINVKPGQKVYKGHTLAVLDSKETENDFASQKSQLEVSKLEDNIATKQYYSAESQLQTAKSEMEVANNQVKRYSALFEKKLITINQFEEYKNSYIKAKSNYEVAQNNLEQAKLNKQKAKQSVTSSMAQTNRSRAQLSNYTVSAPFSGYIGDIPAKVGDYVTPSVQIMAINQTKKLDIYIPVTPKTQKSVHIGDHVDLYSLDNENLGVSKVSFMDKSIDSDSQKLLIRAEYNNEQNVLKPGTKVYAEIKYNKRMSPLVPFKSLRRIGHQRFLFLVNESEQGYTAKQIPVSLGRLHDNYYELLTDLPENSRIITTNIEKIQNQMSINIIPDEGVKATDEY